MKERVYLVEYQSTYEDHGVMGVFSSYELAQAYVDEHSTSEKSCMCISERIVNYYTKDAE